MVTYQRSNRFLLIQLLEKENCERKSVNPKLEKENYEHKSVNPIFDQYTVQIGHLRI